MSAGNKEETGIKNGPFHIAGTVYRVGEIVKLGKDGSFTKRSLVITDSRDDDDRAKCFVEVQAIKDGCARLDGICEGDSVECDVWIRGRRWQKDETSPERFFCEISLASEVKVTRRAMSGVPCPAADGDERTADDAGDSEPLPF